jgi:ribosomal protein L29
MGLSKDELRKMTVEELIKFTKGKLNKLMKAIRLRVRLRVQLRVRLWHMSRPR